MSKRVGVVETVLRHAIYNPSTRRWHLFTRSVRKSLTATKGWREHQVTKAETIHISKPWLVERMPKKIHIGDKPLLRFQESYVRV